MANIGGLGGLGGFDPGNLFAALGHSLLTSPSHAPLSGFPAGIAAANARGDQENKRGALALALTQSGVPQDVAAKIAYNDTAAALFMSQANSAKQMAMARPYLERSGIENPQPNDDGTPAGPAGSVLAPPAAAPPVPRRMGGLGGLGGIAVPDTPAVVASPDASSFRPPPGAPKDLYRDVPADYGGNPAATAPAPFPPARPAALGVPVPALPDDAAPAAGVTARTDANGLPIGQLASNAKIPLAVPSLDIKPSRPPPNVAPGTTTMRVWAQDEIREARRAAMGGRMMPGPMGEAIAKDAEFRLNRALKYLDPSETEKALTSIGIPIGSPEGKAIIRQQLDKRPETVKVAEYAYPGDPNRQQQAVRAGMTDNRPEVVRLGEAAQDAPGLVRSGIDTEAARKGADTRATSREQAYTREAEGATQGARSAGRIMTALNDAEAAFDKAAKGGGTGPLSSSKVARSFDAMSPGWLGSARTNEIARHDFDNAIATVQNAKAAVDLKGQGAVSNFERTLAGADLPSLQSSDPSTSKKAFARLRTQLNSALALDAKYGLHKDERLPPTTATGAPLTTMPDGTTIRQLR